jgi:hypothetical protein
MKIRIILPLILILGFVFYYFYLNRDFSGPVGGWETSKAKIEAKYGYNEQIKLAALQLGNAYQNVIDDPNNVDGLGPLDEGMACILGVLVANGVEETKASHSWTDIESLVVSTYEQQRRYIRFNAKLSGSMLKGIDPDSSKCHFEVKK